MGAIRLGAAVLAGATVLLAGCGGRTAPPRVTTAASPATAPTPRARRAGPSAAATAQRLARLAATGLPVYCGGPKPEVALTFDDGPGVYSRLATKILRRFHVPATWFVVGRNLARFPAEIGRERALGPLEDHSWTHPVLSSLAPAAVESELARTQAAVRQATGRPVQLFRPPYGARNAAVDGAARRLGMVEVIWTVDSADSLGADYAHIARNVNAGLHPGAIVLMHENRGQTIRALRYLILPHLRRLHLRPVTLTRLLADDPPGMAQLRRGPRGCGLPSTTRSAG
jgi:peptidoglycan/xylan/chitin deacetylase (PgdA/CDA1 family)